ncbi:hypothetical protein EON63_08370 [archaeon]|nr:MAG: hypothetical protein EON63_08370 [archaeon]
MRMLHVRTVLNTIQVAWVKDSTVAQGRRLIRLSQLPVNNHAQEAKKACPDHRAKHAAACSRRK